MTAHFIFSYQLPHELRSPWTYFFITVLWWVRFKDNTMRQNCIHFATIETNLKLLRKQWWLLSKKCNYFAYRFQIHDLYYSQRGIQLVQSLCQGKNHILVNLLFRHHDEMKGHKHFKVSNIKFKSLTEITWS